MLIMDIISKATKLQSKGQPVAGEEASQASKQMNHSKGQSAHRRNQKGDLTRGSESKRRPSHFDQRSSLNECHRK